jgi:hypothetical protein
MYAIKQKKTSSVGISTGKDRDEATVTNEDEEEDNLPKESIIKKIKEFFADFF